MLAEQPPPTDDRRAALVKTLRRQTSAVEEAATVAGDVCSTGSAAFDRILPQRGLRRGTLTEWLSSRPGSGATTLSLLAAASAAGEDEWIVVCDRGAQFYALAAAAWGLSPARLLVVRPSRAADELWVLDQALRCPGVAAVWSCVKHLAPRDFRRLQLAAEEGKTLGLFCRPSSLRGRPSWAHLQLLVEPQRATTATGRCLRVEVVRARHGPAGASLVLELDDIRGAVRERASHEAHPVSANSAPAAPAPRRQQA
jgi:hypothetical protein